jgi:hypothetical protein
MTCTTQCIENRPRPTDPLPRPKHLYVVLCFDQGHESSVFEGPRGPSALTTMCLVPGLFASFPHTLIKDLGHLHHGKGASAKSSLHAVLLF